MSDSVVMACSAAVGAALAGYVAYRVFSAQHAELLKLVQANNSAAVGPVQASAVGTAAPVLARVDSMRGARERDELAAKVPQRVQTQVPSMEDAVNMQEAAKQDLEALTPSMVLSNLQQGNARFWMGIAQRPELSAMERRAMIMQQFPKAAILGCSDSRVPIEIVFDQGLGDIFAIRVAGNAYGTGVAASIDYAVNHLKVKLVVVLGHEGCGAVRAAMLPSEKVANEPEHLRKWLTAVRRGLAEHEGLNRQLISDLRARDREAVITNVRAQMRTISSQPNIRAKVAEGSLLVVGGFYEITSGMVDFVEQLDKPGLDAAAERDGAKTPLNDNLPPVTPTDSNPPSPAAAMDVSGCFDAVDDDQLPKGHQASPSVERRPSRAYPTE